MNKKPEIAGELFTELWFSLTNDREGDFRYWIEGPFAPEYRRSLERRMGICFYPSLEESHQSSRQG